MSGPRPASERDGSSGIGARGIEGAARSVCERRRHVAALGIDQVALAARHLTGIALPAQLSPFAVEAGARFERSLYADSCAKLRATYAEAGLEPLASIETPVEVVMVGADGAVGAGSDGGRGDGDGGDGDGKVAREQIARTLRALVEPGDGVRIVVQGVLELGVGARIERIRPDVLVGDLSARRWWVGEAKSYLDRGGATSRSHVGHACGQLAVGVVALRETLEAARLGGAGSVLSSGDLFLSSYGRGATLHRLGLDVEIRCVEAFLAEARDLDGKGDPTGSAAELFARIEAIDALPARLRSSCREACGLYELCVSREAGPRGLSDGARRVVARLGGLERAVRLARGEEEPRLGEEPAVVALRAGFDSADRCAESGADSGGGAGGGRQS